MQRRGIIRYSKKNQAKVHPSLIKKRRKNQDSSTKKRLDPSAGEGGKGKHIQNTHKKKREGKRENHGVGLSPARWVSEGNGRE